MRINKLFLLVLTTFNLCANQNSFVFIIPSYNNQNWYEKNLNSVIKQTYKNYRVIYINDCSTDNTGLLVEKYIKDNNLAEKITLINNTERKGALENIYNAIQTCKPNDIIVCADGDDWLANDNVLNKLNNVYSDKDVWLTYGQYSIYPENYLGGCREIPSEVFTKNETRSYDWVTSHLRTFYAGLFQQIKKDDLIYENKFYPMAWDAALMYPMLEMAGKKHVKFIDDILYIYNTQTPLNDNKINKELQCKLFYQIRSKPSYNLISDFRDKKFVVLITSYNNSNFYKQNLDSIFNQTYTNYRVIYVDDNSPDRTGEFVEKYVQEKNQSHRFTLIKNKKRELALANIYKSVIKCEDDEIIVLVDGDDWLAHNDVLSTLNNLYKTNNIWITHGTFQNVSDGSLCHWALPIPQDVISENKFREYPHGLVHLRTFYSWLFKQIKIEDLFHETYFYRMTYDVAILLPMTEMAADRHKLINSVTYMYNDLNPINDHRVSMDLQHHLNRVIRAKNRYSKLEKSQENFLEPYASEKTDIIIFSYDAHQLDTLLKNLRDKKNINKILIFYDQEAVKPLIKKYPHIIFINKGSFNQPNYSSILNAIIKQKSSYIFITSDTYIKQIPNFEELIKTLELTKAYSTYFMEQNNTLEKEINSKHVEILKDVYAFEFENYTLSPYIAGVFLRKKDLMSLSNYSHVTANLELEWKYIGWKKICLLEVCGI